MFNDTQIEEIMVDAFKRADIHGLLLCEIVFRLSALEKLYSGKDSSNDGGNRTNDSQN